MKVNDTTSENNRLSNKCSEAIERITPPFDDKKNADDITMPNNQIVSSEHSETEGRFHSYICKRSKIGI